MNYTTIEQSKKLVEAGLDSNTADMFYVQKQGIPIIMNECFSIELDLPCWSIGALIELMPAYITTNYTIGSNLFIQRVGNSYGESGFRIYYKLDENAAYTDFITSYDYKNLIDAVFETILWLLENNYIKKGEIK